jgi:phage tail tape-measure protein
MSHHTTTTTYETSSNYPYGTKTTKTVETHHHQPKHSHETLKGAAGGAAVASVVPGIGTAVGAVVGAAIGHHEKKKHKKQGTHKE